MNDDHVGVAWEPHFLEQQALVKIGKANGERIAREKTVAQKTLDLFQQWKASAMSVEEFLIHMKGQA